MKIAVLVFGEFREFENAHKSWTFLNHIDYDLYLSTWNISHEINEEYLNINLCEDVTPDRILKYFPNAIINIDNPITSSYSTKITYHWRKLFNMVDISGKEYENVILIRPELMIKENGELYKIINSKITDPFIYNLSGIIHYKPPVFLYVQDVFFIGNYKLMKDIFLSFTPPDVTYKDIHFHLSKHFINNDVYIETLFPHVVLNYYIMRTIHRKFLNVDFDLQKIISEEWWLLKRRNQVPIKILELLKNI